MKKLIPFLFLLSCTYSIRPDSATPYKDSNYLSVESEICGVKRFGVNGCTYKEGETTNNRFLKIQGYYKGQIEIFSELCNINKVERYEENELKVFKITDLLGDNTFVREHSCTLTVIVSPDYIEKSTETVYPRIGKVFIEVNKTDVEPLKFAVGDQTLSGSSQRPFSFTLPVKENGRFLFLGCNGEERAGIFRDGEVTLPVMNSKDSCKYQIAFRTDTKKYSWIFYRNVYEKTTDILPNPSIKRTDGEICIEGDKSTLSFVSINEKWENSNKLCVKGKGPFEVRSFTVKRNSYVRVK